MTDILISYMTSGILNIIMLLFLLHLVMKNVILSELETKSYIITIILTISVIIAELATNVFDIYGEHFRIPNIIANIIGFTVSAYIPYFLAVVYDQGLVKKLKYILLPAILNSVLFITTIWTGWMFHISEQNEYSRGPLFILYILAYLYGFLLLIHANHKLSLQFVGADKFYLSLLYVVFLIGSCIQVCLPQIHSTWHCITITLVLYYIFQRERQFKYDVITGLLNRSAFENQLKRVRQKENAILIILDLNKFKEINDTYGHQIGDDCIKIAADAIKTSFQHLGYCYRIGGDEFCVIGSNKHVYDILPCIRTMMNILNQKRESLPYIPHIAYGYSIYRKSEGKDIMQIFQEADENMYAYKKSTEENEFKDSCEGYHEKY